MDNILSLIRPELFILIAVLYCIGLFLKLNPNFKKEYTIPYILVFISIVLCQAYMSIVLEMGFAPKIIIVSFIQAILIAAVPVFGNELLKQALRKRLDDEAGASPSQVKKNLYK